MRARAQGKQPAVAEGAEAAASDDEITLEGHYLPFGPYLALAGLLYLFFGPELIAAYIAALQHVAPAESVTVL